MDKNHKNKIIALFLLGAAAFILLSLFSFQQTDLSFFVSSPNSSCENYGGIVGAYLSFFFLSTLGFPAYLIPLICLLWGIDKLKKKEMGAEKSFFVQLAGISMFLICFSALLSKKDNIWEAGILGIYLFSSLYKYFNDGTYIIIVVFFILSSFLIKDLFFFSSFLNIAKKIRLALVNGLTKLNAKFKQKKEERKKHFEQIRASRLKENIKKPHIKIASRVPSEKNHLPKKRLLRTETSVSVANEDIENETATYQCPPLSLLKSPPPLEQRKIKDNLQANAKILEETLLDFGIEVKVVGINRGPAVTCYELLPAAGVKINRIVNLSDNIALAMKAQSVRFITPIPGKAAVGVEVPNSSTTIVYCQEILSSEHFNKSKFLIPLVLGKDVTGMPLLADLAEMPHLLIAGATGSGKTVCVNNLIINLLFKFSPDELKLLIIDPKMIELSAFNDIPHLLCPAVTDAKKAALALKWAVTEMERRFHLLAEVGARNIKIYNEKQNKNVLPYIIILVDELADLMMTASKEVEGTITRLAQLSRAVGIHIILATQRPSVDVITGVIKANFPARISFKVASKVDSRTVLDVNGADKLLGNGDMLFLQPGSSKPTRAQGVLVFDEEIERIVNFLKKQGKPIYDEKILRKDSKESRTGLEKDNLYEEAVEMVLQSKHASVSLLQRRLGIGYSRAARIIDMMEEEGIVGPPVGSKPREILIDRE